MLRIVPTSEKSGFEKLQAPFHRIKLTLKGGERILFARPLNALKQCVIAVCKTGN